MSDTTTDAANAETPALPEIANFSIGEASYHQEGKTLHQVTFGTRRAVIRDLSLADEWDLLEHMPADPNPTWRAMTMMAYSLDELDGVAQVIFKNAPGGIIPQMRQRIAKLGEDGMQAIMRARMELASKETTAEIVAAAKN